MKYTFSYKEINYGTISIDADHKPTRAEIEDAIWGSNEADIEKTRYENIRLVDPDRQAPKKERQHER